MDWRLTIAVLVTGAALLSACGGEGGESASSGARAQTPEAFGREVDRACLPFVKQLLRARRASDTPIQTAADLRRFVRANRTYGIVLADVLAAMQGLEPPESVRQSWDDALSALREQIRLQRSVADAAEQADQRALNKAFNERNAQLEQVAAADRRLAGDGVKSSCP